MKLSDHLPSFCSGVHVPFEGIDKYKRTVSHLKALRLNESFFHKVHKKYDLKGSTVDREASQKEREKDHPTFKDNDFLSDGVKIHIGEEAKEKLMKTLRVSSVDSIFKRDRFIDIYKTR